MGGGLKGIKHDKRKYDTSLNICKVPPSLEEAWKPSVVRSVASDNDGIEYRNYIVTDMYESDDESVNIYLLMMWIRIFKCQL